MSDELDTMFDAGTENAVTGARSLEGTARLTALSNTVVGHIFTALEGSMDERREQVTASQKSHSAMDILVHELGDLESQDTSFITELSEDVVGAMLKSQQSKRSRTKGKVMTLDNYRSMMVGAVAENLIRQATGKTKLAGGARRAAGDIGFSDEQLEVLAANQDELKRELRNIQSKKSIAKSKDGFSEESEHWAELLAAEAALKGIRVNTGRTKTVVVDTTKDALAALIAEGLPPKEFARRAAELMATGTSVVEEPVVVDEPAAE